MMVVKHIISVVAPVVNLWGEINLSDAGVALADDFDVLFVWDKLEHVVPTFRELVNIPPLAR